MENQTQKTSIKDRVVSWLLRALLEQFRATIEQLSQDLHALVVREQLAFLKEARAAARPRAYVTLRCEFISDGKVRSQSWTIGIDVAEGKESVVPFYPQNECRVRRAEVNGPVTITGVAVGREQVTQATAEYPASLDLDETCLMGNSVRVFVKGLP